MFRIDYSRIDYSQIFVFIQTIRSLVKFESLLLFFICLSLLPQPGFAHNGAIAYAYPLNNITLDGDLDDWPDEMISYPITQLGAGVAAENETDFNAYFRIGFNQEDNTIFIAVVIRDQSIVLDSGRKVNWDTHDGMEVYLDPNNQRPGSELTQYGLYAGERMIFGHNRSWDGIEVVSKVTDTSRVYEWSVKPGIKIYPGITMTFDLAVEDMDSDKSFSWVSWGKNTQKISSPNNCGDLILVQHGTKIASVQGKLDISGLTANPGHLPVQFRDVHNSQFYLQTFSDSLGSYALSLPAGDYLLDIPAQLIVAGDDYYRLAPNNPHQVNINPDEPTKLPILMPKLIAGPEFPVKEGVLHEFDGDQSTAVDSFVETYQEFYSIPGLSLALINGNEIVYYKTYGVKNATTKEPVTEETLFEAASITKPVFGFVVLSLAEKGIIDLDKPLYEYLPFEALEITPEYKKMTARHVLIHRSGLPNWGVPLINTPGTEYGYSGEGFEYLKRVVVEITGKPVEQLLDEELIEPLGLYHMEFKDSEELRKVASSGHLGSNPTGWPIPSEPGMAHSMHTEAKAFSGFAIALLNQQGLSENTYLELAKIHTETPKEYWDSPEYQEGAGLGLHIRESGFGKVIGHGGNNGDFKCLFEVYQDLGMGYVVFTNSDMGDQLAGDLAEFLVEGNSVRTGEQ